MTEAYPLQWPDHIARSERRETGKFQTTLARALDNVEGSLRRFASDSGKEISGMVVSSNYSLTSRRPEDPGVSVWFTWDGLQVCIPVDRYSSVEANLQAIHHVLEARRTELRHGTLELVRASFRGFQALPPPNRTGAEAPWWQILGVDRGASEPEIRAAYKARVKMHQAAGTLDAILKTLNVARDAGIKEEAQ